MAPAVASGVGSAAQERAALLPAASEDARSTPVGLPFARAAREPAIPEQGGARARRGLTVAAMILSPCVLLVVPAVASQLPWLWSNGAANAEESKAVGLHAVGEQDKVASSAAFGTAGPAVSQPFAGRQSGALPTASGTAQPVFQGRPSAGFATTAPDPLVANGAQPVFQGRPSAAGFASISPDPLAVNGVLQSVAARIDSSIAVQRQAALAAAAAAAAGTTGPPFSQQRPAAPAAPARRGSFLVIGDWGYDDGQHGNIGGGQRCQRAIADRMLERFEELGDVAFIINVGDSFYPEGVKSKDDPQWDTKWRDVYDERLRSVPWYSVYGNHDYHQDPCICSADVDQCAQVNYNINNLTRFYMPGYNWYITHPEFDMEVVGMDLNKFMEGWNRSASHKELQFNDCLYTPCKDDCFGNAESRASQAFELFSHRFQHSTARNLLVFSHYPTDYFTSVPEFLGNLSDNEKHDIFYFGGHRHNTDNFTTWQTQPNVNWLVGGGGGWSCDGKEQGFVVGEIDVNYRVTTNAELVDYMLCCPPPPTTTTTTLHRRAA